MIVCYFYLAEFPERISKTAFSNLSYPFIVVAVIIIIIIIIIMFDS